MEGCSEPDKSLSWEKRKEHIIEFLRTASNEIRTFACAEKLHNIKSIFRDYEQNGDAVWGGFNRGRYYRNIIESLGYSSTFKLLEELQEGVDK